MSIYQYDVVDQYWAPVDDGYTYTDANGDYSFTVPEGNYRLGFADYDGGHVGEYFADVDDVDYGTTVPVASATPAVVDVEPRPGCARRGHRDAPRGNRAGPGPRHGLRAGRAERRHLLRLGQLHVHHARRLLRHRRARHGRLRRGVQRRQLQRRPAHDLGHRVVRRRDDPSPGRPGRRHGSRDDRRHRRRAGRRRPVLRHHHRPERRRRPRVRPGLLQGRHRVGVRRGRLLPPPTAPTSSRACVPAPTGCSATAGSTGEYVQEYWNDKGRIGNADDVVLSAADPVEHINAQPSRASTTARPRCRTPSSRASAARPSWGPP